MADNTDTLGNFKIKVEVEGQQSVKTELDKIRAGLKQLERELGKVTKEGEKLADVLKSLKSPNIKLSGSGKGSAGGADVFLKIGKEAKEATKHISKFAEALKDAKSSAGALGKGFSKAEALFGNKVIGEVKRDVDGHITGRTGLRGISYSIGAINKQMRGGLTNVSDFNKAFKDVIGESRKDPATGKWKYTGTKATLHSLDALSKAARGAATNLTKIAKIKGIGGGAGGGTSDVGSMSMFEQLLKSMKGSEKTLGGIGKMISYTNVGNSTLLEGLDGVFQTLGHIVGIFKSGPIGIGLGVLSAGAKYVETQQGHYGAGINKTQELWRQRKFQKGRGIDAGDVDNYALQSRMSFAQYDENGILDAKATNKAAQESAMNKAASVRMDLALMRTGVGISPRLRAMAMAGIPNWVKMKTPGQQLEAIAAFRDKMKKRGVRGEDRWLRFVNEAELTEDEIQATEGGMQGLKEHRKTGESIGKESLYDKGNLNEAEKNAPKNFSTQRDANLAYVHNTSKVLGATESPVNKGVNNFFQWIMKGWEDFTRGLSLGNSDKYLRLMGVKRPELRGPNEDNPTGANAHINPYSNPGIYFPRPGSYKGEGNINTNAGEVIKGTNEKGKKFRKNLPQPLGIRRPDGTYKEIKNSFDELDDKTSFIDRRNYNADSKRQGIVIKEINFKIDGATNPEVVAQTCKRVFLDMVSETGDMIGRGTRVSA